MQGNNELILNTATMIEAVQLWLDAQMHHAPKVTGVAIEKGQGYSSSTFSVSLDADCDRADPRQDGGVTE